MLADSVLEDMGVARRKKAEHFIVELVHLQSVIRVLEQKQVGVRGILCECARASVSFVKGAALTLADYALAQLCYAVPLISTASPECCN